MLRAAYLPAAAAVPIAGGLSGNVTLIEIGIALTFPASCFALGFVFLLTAAL